MANVGIAVAAVAATSIASGGHAPWLGCLTAVRPNITHQRALPRERRKGNWTS